ncbi:MAG: hypothetical protein RI885_570 [Actinomycetota bacterium]|jgi:hypothetical protein
MSTQNRITLSAAAVAAVMLATGCSAGSGSAGSTDAATLEIGSIDLSASCPETVVVQTDWNPESEHGHLYELLGDDPEIDAEAKSVRGPLLASGGYTGIDLEVRAGGPAIGFQPVTAQLYQDTSITLGYVSTDEALQSSADLPTTAVFAPLDRSPLMIMWDPETYPEVTTVDELADEGAIIRYYGGSAYMAYLVGAGIVPEEQADGGFDGTPANFVAAGGADAQQGFATSDPYIYSEEIADWGREIDYQLIDDLGFPYYQAAMAVRSGELDQLTPCLEQLVPVLQQGQVDFVADSAATNELIVRLVDEYDTGWVYAAESAEYATASMVDLGLVSNGEDTTIGDFDPARVSEVMDAVGPVFEENGTPLADGLTPDDIVTNEFIDETIGLP